MQHDIEIIPGTSGTMGHELGLVLNYKIPASGKPVDLSGAKLVFIASAGGSAVLEVAPTAVMQMAAPGPAPGSAPFVVTNDGIQPEGYVYIGANHGASVWGRVDAVAASVPEGHGDSGNAVDM